MKTKDELAQSIAEEWFGALPQKNRSDTTIPMLKAMMLEFADKIEKPTVRQDSNDTAQAGH